MKKIISVLVLIIIVFGSAISQKPQGMKPQGSGSILGTVIDKTTNQPLEYSTVAVYSIRDSVLISGSITNNQGVFEIKDISYGMYYIVVQFLGYETKTIEKVKVNPKKPLFDLGDIVLNPSVNSLEGVDVIADQSPVLYKIDKKIINVSSNLNASGGSAVDVLENTPSVDVDIEGNVSLRGSENFTVLIDGRPSPFSGTDALEQIPSGLIEQVEIITNPSVKYNPDGTAGIINIITKKKNLQGTSGIVNVNADTKGSYGADFTVNLKRGDINYFIGANYNQRRMEGYRENETRTLFNDTTNYILSHGDRNGGRLSSGIKGGFDYSPSLMDNVLFSIEVGEMDFERTSESDYQEFTLPESVGSENLSSDISQRGRTFLNLNLDYSHKFNPKGHEIKTFAMFRTGNSSSENSTYMFDYSDAPLNGHRSLENADNNEMQFKVDYSLPFTETRKFEAGLQARIDYEEESYNSLLFDINSDIYVEDPTTSTVSDYHRNIYSAYSLYLGEFKSFGYQVGLRGEYTDRLMHNVATDEEYFIDRIDFFPSAHISLQLPFDQQLMASYSRRIERPRSYFLEPFLTYRDAYTIYQGNPELEPEYINSYELSYQKKFGMSFFSIEAYLRQNNNKIERIRTVYSENIMLHSFDNIGNDLASGTELMLNWKANKWYSLNMSGNVYYYKIDSDLLTDDIENESTNWSTRIRNTFNLGKRIRFQVDGNYRDPTIFAQGRMEGFFMVGSAVSMEFLDGKLKANLQVRDIFGTGHHEFETYGDGFYSYMYFERNAPVFKISLTYKINNYREKKKSRSDGSNFDGDMDF